MVIRLSKNSMAFSIILISIFFFPAYLSSSASFSSGQLLVFFASVSLSILFALASYPNLKFIENSMVYMYFGLVCIFLTITFVKSFFISDSLGAMFTSVRYLYYLIFLSCILILINKMSFTEIKKCLSFVLYLEVLISLLLVMGIPLEYFKVFIKKEQVNFLGPRIGGTFEYSYSLGYVFLGMISYHLMQLRIKNRFFILRLGILLLLFTLLAMTQSKTAIVCVVMAMCVLYLRHISLSKFFYSLALIGVTVFLLYLGMDSSTVFLNNIKLDHVINGFEILTSGELDSSATYRLYQLEVAFEQILSSLFLGGLNDISFNIENAYVYYFYEFGLIGLIAYLLFLLNIFRLGLISYSKGSTNLECSFGLTLMFTPVFAVSFSPTDAHRLALCIIVMLALIIKFQQESNTETKNKLISLISFKNRRIS